MADDIAALWIGLDRARFRPDGNIMQRLAKDSWEHDDPQVQAAWEALTRPENLPGLEAWMRPDMNPYARQATERAIAGAKARCVR